MQTSSDANCDLRFSTEKTLAACRTFMSAKTQTVDGQKRDFNLSAKTWRYFKWCPGRNSSSMVKLWLKPSTCSFTWTSACVGFCFVFFYSPWFFCVFMCRPSDYNLVRGKPPLELPLFSPSWLLKRKTWLHHGLPHSLFPEPDQPVVGLGRVSTVNVFMFMWTCKLKPFFLF